MADNVNYPSCGQCFGASMNDCNKCPHDGKERLLTMNIGRNPEEQERIDKLVDLMGIHLTSEIICNLFNRDFFIKPASIHHHGQYDGALFDHSYEVTKALVDMTRKLGLTWKLDRSPYIVGMFHDLCKLDNYVKSSGDESWEYNNATLLPGHGEKSVIYAQELMKLTDEEIFCIRWHMGAFDSKENWNSYGRACTQFPNVLYTHTADMIAARIKGV